MYRERESYIYICRMCTRYSRRKTLRLIYICIRVCACIIYIYIDRYTCIIYIISTMFIRYSRRQNLCTYVIETVYVCMCVCIQYRMCTM